MVHWHVNWHGMLWYSKLTTGCSVMVAFFLTMVKIELLLGRIGCQLIILLFLAKACKNYFFLFEMPDRSIGTSAVAYGIERMNREVSHWMRGLSDRGSSPNFPFIATKGYDSVVWNRLYSRDASELTDSQINQVSTIYDLTIFLSSS